MKLSIAEAANEAGYGVFASALGAAAHLSLLESEGPFTVFAPSDHAFEKFSDASLGELLCEDGHLLRLVMGYHFTLGQVSAAQFAGKRVRARMHSGGDLIINGRAGLHVNAAHVVEPDIRALNGVIHGIDAVLWPKRGAMRAALDAAYA